MLTFAFPEDEEQFRIVRSKEQLVDKVRAAQVESNVARTYFGVSYIKERYLYARCQVCSAKLTFRQDQGTFRLVRFHNIHHHPASQARQQNLAIEEFIRSLPASTKYSNARELTKFHFHISDRKFYYLHAKVHRPKMDFKALITRLDQLKYETRYQPFPIPPQIIPSTIITSSESMRHNFARFGQFVSIDVTYNLVREKVNGVGWGVALFVGLNAHNHIVPFAVGLLNSESENAFYELFLSFFDIMKGEPDCILSDEQHSIRSALINLQEAGRWSGHHLLDQFHILHNLKKKLKRGQLFTYLQRAVMAQTTSQYRHWLKMSGEYIENESEAKIVRQLEEKNKQISMAHAPAVFMGLSISTSFNEKLNDIIKQHIPHELPASLCLDKLLRVCQLVEHKSLNFSLCKTKYEELFRDQELKLLRYSYENKVYEQFIRNYVSSLSLHPTSSEKNKWSFRTEDGELDCQVSLLYERFSCTCELTLKKGIPCQHILYLLRNFRQPYNRYFHPRWNLIQRVPQPKSYTVRKGRPRASRRNMVK